MLLSDAVPGADDGLASVQLIFNVNLKLFRIVAVDFAFAPPS